MIGTELLAEAWKMMGSNRLRTLLTMLGMIIGVGAVVLMLAIGQGVQYMVQQSVSSMGSHIFIILSGASTSGGIRFGAGTSPTLNTGDAHAIAQLPTVSAVAPSAPGTAQLVYGPNNWSTMVIGTTPSYIRVRDWVISRGTSFTDNDVRSATRVVVLGQTVAHNLFWGEDPVGKTIRIQNNPFLVVGLLREKGQSLDGRDQDDSALVPITTAQRVLFGTAFPGSIRYMMVQARSAETMNRAQADMVQLLRERHRIAEGQEDDFTIRNLTAIAQAAASMARIMAIMLGAIASISLLVGGIGIMNIMLVSVTERTREIGIRMAIGARRRDILLQFLLEAFILSFLGGLIGIFLGIVGAWAASVIFDMTVVVSSWAILLSFAVAAVVGIFFGLYPARKAAALRPTEALRYE